LSFDYLYNNNPAGLRLLLLLRKSWLTPAAALLRSSAAAKAQAKVGDNLIMSTRFKDTLRYI
jgi:hypothetical protein